MDQFDNGFDRLIVIGVIGCFLILALLFGDKRSGAPDYSTDSHNVTITTNTTNVDICGICINTDR